MSLTTAHSKGGVALVFLLLVFALAVAGEREWSPPRQTLWEARQAQKARERQDIQRLIRQAGGEVSIPGVLEPEPTQDEGHFFDTSTFLRQRRRDLLTGSVQASSCDLPDPCAPHGLCMIPTGCSCYHDSVNGYWRGTSCDECDFGYFGSDCKSECPGGSCNPCNSNGVCNQGSSGDGTCTCYSDSSRGFWSGASCSQCEENYYGPGCKFACSGLSNGLVCSGRGKCFAGTVESNGTCACQTGFGSNSSCADCDASHFGDNCQFLCDGYLSSADTPCAGHGTCWSGLAGNGSCVCFDGWAGAYCDVQCPGEGQCFGNGTCWDTAAGNGTCTCGGNRRVHDCKECSPYYTGSSCTVPCHAMRASDDLEICTGNGKCVTMNEQDASCSCFPGYQGRFCQIACPGSPPCSGHGTCTLVGDVASCDCASGWQGDETCATCSLAVNNSASCSLPCPVDALGVVCSGKGTCVEGRCYCTRTDASDPCGSACQSFDACTSYCTRRFFYGSTCQTECPGVGPRILNTQFQYACNGHGYCSEGITGSGRCQCLAGWNGTACELQCPNATVLGRGVVECSGQARGLCHMVTNSTTAVECRCRPQFAGRACELDCPLMDGSVCGGHGACNPTTAVCKCDVGWTGTSCHVPCLCNSRHGHCDDAACANYLAGETCDICLCDKNFTGRCFECAPGSQGYNCDGLCVHGTTVGTECVCNATYGTESCSQQCASANGQLCAGHGNCLDGNRNSGTCDCKDGYYSSSCAVFCTVEYCRSLGIDNPQCNVVTGACECQQSSQGMWKLGSGACDECVDGYWGPTCNEVCDCSNHGSCSMNTGECLCYSDSVKGFFAGVTCATCKTGYIGEGCNTQSIPFSIVERNVTVAATAGSIGFVVPVTLQQLETADEVVLPQSTVLMIDESVPSQATRFVYLGGSPVLALQLVDSNLVVVDSTHNAPMASTLLTARQCSLTNSSSSIKPDVVHMWRDNDTLYFLAQPVATQSCFLPARIVVAKRPVNGWAASARSWIGDLRDYSGLGAEVVAALGNKSYRIRSVVSQSDTGVPTDVKHYRGIGDSVIAIVLSPMIPPASSTNSSNTTTTQPQDSIPSGGIHWASGGFLIVLVVTKNNAATSATSVTVPDGFFVTDVALSPLNVNGLKQKVAISGQFGDDSVGGHWDVLWWSLTNGRLDLTVPFVSVRARTPCWPLLEDNSVLDQAADGSPLMCSRCRRAWTLQFTSQDAMVVGIQGLAQGILAWIRPLVDVDPTRRVWHNASGSCTFHTRPTAQQLNTGTTWYVASIAAVSGESAAIPTAVAHDFFTSVSYLTLRGTTSTSLSLVVKVLLSDSAASFALYGVHTYLYVLSSNRIVPEVIGRMEVAPLSRFLYTATTHLRDLRLVTFVLYEVFSVTPDFVSPSGTQLQLTGRGFTTAVLGSGPQCVVGNQRSPATLLNSSSATCVAPTLITSSATSDLTCAGQSVDLTLFQGSSRFGVTDNGLTIKRIDLPTLSTTEPLRGNYTSRTVTVVGSNFVESPFSKCRFRRVTPTFEEFSYAPATVVDPSHLTCVQPAISVPNYTTLDVTLDDQVYSSTTVSFPILSPGNGIVGYPAVTTLVASDIVLVNLSAATIDETGALLLDLDNTVRDVILFVDVVDNDVCSHADFVQWRSPTDGFPWPPCRNTTINNQTRTASAMVPIKNTDPRVAPSLIWNELSTEHAGSLGFLKSSVAGVALFQDLLLYMPRPGSITISALIVSRGWEASLTIRLIPGFPTQLMIQNRASFLSNAIAIPAKEGTPLSQVLVYVVDASGNQISILDDRIVASNQVATTAEINAVLTSLVVTATSFYVPDTCGDINVTAARLNNDPCIRYQTLPTDAVFGTSSFTFLTLALPYIHGAYHYITFTSTNVNGKPLIPATTPPFRTSLCSVTQYKVPMTGECKECPTPGGTCNGTETIRVAPGYWRAANSSSSIYFCKQGESVCIGSASNFGSDCATGAGGALCADCVPKVTSYGNGSEEVTYYGKSKLTDCSECPNPLVNSLLLGIGAFVVFVALVVWTFCTLRTETTSDAAVVLRTAINHMQATGELGQFSTRVGPFLKGVFSVSSGGSSFSINGVQFLDCFLRQRQLGYNFQFYAQMCVPVVAALIGVSVYVVVSILKLKPLLGKELLKEIDNQEKILGENGAFVSLKHRYPLFMVFTTTSCVTLFTFYQTLISQATGVLACQPIVVNEPSTTVPAAEEWVLSVDVTQRCSANGISPYFLPGQLFAIGYGFGIPLTFIFGYKFMNGRLGMPVLTNFMFLFLTGGYKNQFWYWQAVIMVRKFLLVLAAVFITDEQIRNSCGMWIMAIALGLQLGFKPAENTRHNEIEAISLSIITMTLNLGLLYYWPGLPEWAETLLTVVLLIITFVAFIMILVYMLDPVRKLFEEVREEIRALLADSRQSKQERLAAEREHRRQMLAMQAGMTSDGNFDDTAIIRRDRNRSDSNGPQQTEFFFDEFENAEQAKARAMNLQDFELGSVGGNNDSFDPDEVLYGHQSV